MSKELLTGLISSAEAAKRLGISQIHVTRLINWGKIKAIKIGTAPNSPWLIDEESVQQYLDSPRS